MDSIELLWLPSGIKLTVWNNATETFYIDLDGNVLGGEING